MKEQQISWSKAPAGEPEVSQSKYVSIMYMYMYIACVYVWIKFALPYNILDDFNTVCNVSCFDNIYEIWEALGKLIGK